MSLTIRKALEIDAEAISELILGLASYYVDEPDSPEVRPFLDSFLPEETKKRIASPDFQFFVAEDGSGICGVVAMRETTHLFHLFVRADLHGHGIARTLWDYVRFLSDVTTYTVNSSIFAVPVYKRLGFEATDEPQLQDGIPYVPMKYRPGKQAS